MSESATEAHNGPAIEPEGDWYGLYKSGSRDDHLFTNSSTRHPAKMSLALTNKILDTMQEWGWIETGSLVVDPFGGRGTTALCWLARNAANRALTVELEPHFVEMQQKNKEHAERRLHRELAWVILQGDSRRFDEYYAEGKAASVLSAPYAMNDGTRGRKKSSREWDVERGYEHMAEGSEFRGDADYGDTPGQIGNLPDSAITSAPYENSITDAKPGIDMSKSKRLASGRKDEGANSQVIIGGYQSSASVLSAPYENSAVAPQGAGGTQEWNEAYRKAQETGDWSAFREQTRQAAETAGYGDAAVLSAPYAAAENRRAAGKVQEGEVSDAITRAYDATNHGQTEGQIANLPDACVTSAPYENSTQPGGGEKGARGGDSMRRIKRDYIEPAAVTSAPFEDSLASDDPDKRGGFLKSDPKRRNDPGLTATYGDAAAVTSAPWEGADNAHPSFGQRDPVQVIRDCRAGESSAGDIESWKKVPQSPSADNQQGQIGVLQSETYAQACGLVYASLAKAGIRYVASVTKDPVKNKKLRPLRLLTISLFEQAGYRLVAWRRAHLFATEGEENERAGQGSLFGDELEESKRLVGRLSFFRRLSLAKGGIAARWEDVLFFRLADPEEQPEPEKPEKPVWVQPELF